MSALFVAHHMKVKAVVSLTQSGSTALWMSRIDSGVPIYALTPEEASRRRMCLYREVHPIVMTYHAQEREEQRGIGRQSAFEAVHGFDPFRLNGINPFTTRRTVSRASPPPRGALHDCRGPGRPASTRRVTLR